MLTLWRDFEADRVAATEMENAIDLARFYLQEAARIAGAAVGSKELERAEKLRKWLVERFDHDVVVVRDVARRVPNRDLRSAPAARAALKILEQHGWLVPLEPGTVVRGAARKEAWRIVRGPAKGALLFCRSRPPISARAGVRHVRHVRLGHAPP